MATVRFAVSYDVMDVTQAEHELIASLYRRNEGSMRIVAIKFLRNQYGIGLRQAKDVCDSIGECKL